MLMGIAGGRVVKLRLLQTFVHKAAGSFSDTMPASAAWVVLKAWGPGGNADQYYYGAGGGGFAMKVRATTPGEVISGSVGNPGSPTTLDGMVANSGARASTASTGVTAAGGTATGGDVNYTGGRGSNFISGGGGGGAAGESGNGADASTVFGGGGSGTLSGDGGGGNANGTGPGGGGGGNNSGATTGGSGYRGAAVVEVYGL